MSPIVDLVPAEKGLTRFFSLSRSVSLAMIENGKASDPLVSSDHTGSNADHEHDLVRLKYSKVQKASPEFQTVYEGVDQTIAVELSSFNFSVAPVPILSLYDYIMTTFVPKDKEPNIPAVVAPVDGSLPSPDIVAPVDSEAPSDKIRVRVKLTRARGASFLQWQRSASPRLTFHLFLSQSFSTTDLNDSLLSPWKPERSPSSFEDPPFALELRSDIFRSRTTRRRWSRTRASRSFSQSRETTSWTSATRPSIPPITQPSPVTTRRSSSEQDPSG